MNGVDKRKLQLSLFTLRIGVFIVFIMWTIDKFINPSHAAAVFKKFYMIDSISNSVSYAIGAVQLAILIGFLLGLKKRFTYGAILILHTVSTLSTWKVYLDPWGPRNLLFFAAIPMLAAIFTLYNMRDEDRLLTLG